MCSYARPVWLSTVVRMSTGRPAHALLCSTDVQWTTGSHWTGTFHSSSGIPKLSVCVSVWQCYAAIYRQPYRQREDTRCYTTNSSQGWHHSHGFRWLLMECDCKQEELVTLNNTLISTKTRGWHTWLLGMWISGKKTLFDNWWKLLGCYLKKSTQPPPCTN